MNKQLLLLSAIFGLSISSASADVNREQLEQFANKADKARLVQNLLVPAAFAAYECKKHEAPLDSFQTSIAVSINEALKNPGMAVHAALETDASLPAALSDAVANTVLINKPQIVLLLAELGVDMANIVKQSVIIGSLTRVSIDLCTVLIRNKMNRLIKERNQDENAMVDRRILRTMVFCATKVVSHMLTTLAASSAAHYAIQNSRYGAGAPSAITVFEFASFIKDTLIPTINYALAEVEGHILAQQLITSEAAAAA